jgi:lysophospholipase L1-like esterase
MFRSLVLALALAAGLYAQEFALKDGDRVVFYGDSITDQRLYTLDTEIFVHTRYPKLHITFTHSGWGGDRVTGGGGGPVDLRVQRDVAPYKPTMITIMLGMNDGGYHPYDAKTEEWYETGFERMMGLLKSAAPGAQFTLIRPSPFDEVTRPPMKHGGYNPALVKIGEFLATVAAREHYLVADFNEPVVRMLEKANAEDFEVAQRIIPDRVHPGGSGHLIMAASLLKAWHADGLVSDVVIDLGAAPEATAATQTGTKVATKAAKATLDGIAKTPQALSWNETEAALPMPVDLNDAPTELALRSAGYLDEFDREELTVKGLAAGHYALRIDGQQVKVFTAEELGKGINLVEFPTPMIEQARLVSELTHKRVEVHNIRWRTIETPLAKDNLTKMAGAMAALDALDAELAQRVMEAAQPKPHHFEVVSVTDVAANVPAGFTPIFDGVDLAGWHVSQTNHHGNSKGWAVANGVLSGKQDRPGNGGILVSDKSYKNHEIYLEVNPDWGCDGGLFLRSTEAGEAYQVMIDYLEGGNVGGVYGEALKGVPGFTAKFEPYWKKGEWNTIRARIEGELPRISVWLNGTQITWWSDTGNQLPLNAVDGHIALQVHGGTRWVAGGQHRFRNIAIRELPQ